MTRFDVDTGRTRLDVRVHPPLFGFRARISGMTGEVEATRADDGRVDLDAAIGAEVSMSINDLDFGNSWLTHTIRGVVDVAGDSSVAGRLLEVEDEPGGSYRISFVVESGPLRGRLQATCQIEWGDDGAAVARGTTEFRAADFDIHVPGLDHLRGVCEWTIVAVPHEAGS
jgi:hypothetical protein